MAMTKVGRRLVPALLAGTLGCSATGVLRRMEREYDSTDTLSPTTVAVMYATYVAHGVALAWACAGRVWPVPFPTRPSRIVGSSLAIGGGAAALVGATPFGFSKQISGISPGSLHMAGVYRYSRNPQYLGLVLAATGASIATRSVFVILLAAGLWAVYRRWIPTEEHHLARIFGTEYTTYQAATARWIGSPRTN